MTAINRSMRMSGSLSVRKVGPPQAPAMWRLKNTLRWAYVWGEFVVGLARWFSKITGIVTLTSELEIRKYDSLTGRWIDYGVVSRRVVTDAGVAFLADDWVDASQEITNMKYHGCGTGTNAEAVGDTALQTESTTILNPDSTRATGVMTNPTAPVVKSVGTVTFDGGGAITEHGIFNQAATGGGTLWDRSVFSAINVVSGDSIVFSYSLTLTSGG